MLRLRALTATAVLVLLTAGDVVFTQGPFFPPRDTPAAPKTGTARLRGRVTSADTRAPLRRAQVSIASPEAAIRRMTTTDGEGRYEFAELPAGRFVITATKGGYVTLQVGQRRPFEPGNPIALAEGETLTNVDVALPRGSVISGRITDEFGEPIAMAQVQAQRYQYGPGGQRRLTFAGGPFIMTDDLGQFRLYGLMPGEYVVSAVVRQMGMGIGIAAGGGSVTDSSEGYAPTFYPGTVNPADAQPVSIGLGQELTISIALAAARMTRITGSVTDSQGNPAAGAMVILRSGEAAMMTAMIAGQVGGDGTFTLQNVAPGDHIIDVRRPGRGSGGEFASLPVTVGNEDISGLRLITGPGATVTGRVTFAGTAPRTGGFGPLRVISQGSDPRAPQMGMMIGGAAFGDGTIAADGTFELGGLSGKLLFRVAAPPDWTLESVSINGEDMTDVPYDFKGAQRLSDVRIVLSDKWTEVSGIVTDDRARPLTDYVVLLLPEEPKEGMAAMRFTRSVRPDQQGSYRVRGLPPGRYLIAALDALEQGGEWDPEFQDRFRSVARAISLTAGQPRSLDLKLTGGL